MTTKSFPFRVLLLSLLLLGVTIGTASVCSASPGDEKNEAVSIYDARNYRLRRNLDGTFFSKHENVAAFTMTVVVAPDSQGHLIGTSTLNSDCLKDVRLEVTVKGSQVTLAGSDEEGEQHHCPRYARRHGHDAEGQLHSERQRFRTVRNGWRHGQSGETLATCLRFCGRARTDLATASFWHRQRVSSEHAEMA